MAWLLDVNLIVACIWSSHRQHQAANRWLEGCERFATCAIAEMGFLRVSMSAAYGASYTEARAALEDLVKMPAHHFIKDATTASRLPAGLTSRHDVTDAHLVTLARQHRLRLATLDDDLAAKPWARGIVIDPLAAVR